MLCAEFKAMQFEEWDIKAIDYDKRAHAITLGVGRQEIGINLHIYPAHGLILRCS